MISVTDVQIMLMIGRRRFRPVVVISVKYESELKNEIENSVKAILFLTKLSTNSDLVNNDGKSPD